MLMLCTRFKKTKKKRTLFIMVFFLLFQFILINTVSTFSYCFFAEKYVQLKEKKAQQAQDAHNSPNNSS